MEAASIIASVISASVAIMLAIVTLALRTEGRLARLETKVEMLAVMLRSNLRWANPSGPEEYNEPEEERRGR
jgi:hypothetical protein